MTAPVSRKVAAGEHIRNRTAWPSRLAAALVILASPVAAWTVVGPNPGKQEANVAGAQVDVWDYLVRPPDIDPEVERLVGVAAIICVGAAGLVLMLASRRWHIDRRWWPPIVAIAVLGVLVGLAGRVVTAAVIGANIGGGIVILLGTPVAVVVVVACVVRSVWILRTTGVAEP